MSCTDAGRNATAGPTWPSAVYYEVDGPGDPLRRVDTVGGGGKLCGVGPIGECDAGENDTDHEFADVGSGDTGGDLVFAEGRDGA